MEYLVELYTPKPAWLVLPETERSAFLEGVQEGMGVLFAGGGIDLIGMGETVADVEHGSGHQYFALWRFASATARERLLEGIAASGWYEYFDHVNTVGRAGEIAAHFDQLRNV